IFDKMMVDYDRREDEFTPDVMREFEKVILLRTVDRKWIDHIDQMDQLRQGIHLRAYGQNDPLREYKFEGFEMFEAMVASIEEEVSRYVMNAKIETNLERKQVAEGKAVHRSANEANESKKRQTPYRKENTVGRN